MKTFLNLYFKIITRQNEYIKSRCKTDNTFRFIHNTKSRFCQVLRRKIEMIDILGLDISNFRRWNGYQFPPERHWKKIEKDPSRPSSSLNVSINEESKEALNCVNTQPLLMQVPSRKGIKFNWFDYRLQSIKVYHFLRLNEEGLNESFHQWDIQYSFYKKLSH